MKNILTIAFMLVCATISAQDTTGVMITLTEVTHLDYKNGLEETYTRKIHQRDVLLAVHSFKVSGDEVLALHLYDNILNAYRTITTLWLDDNYSSDTTFQSRDNIVYSPHGYGPMLVEVSGPIFK
tara:strand:+ start:104 stop:478 length:375 start_codon:yes stop_codon:yes gene_type:complete